MSIIDPDLVRLLKRLKLGPLLPTLPERLTLARAQQLDYVAFLTLLLADEVQRRDQQALERHLAQAGFEDRATRKPDASPAGAWGRTARACRPTPV